MMKGLSWLGSEWGKVIRTPKTVIALLGIMLVPALYGGTYLWAFWDPYAHIEKIPVAVVNEDQPVTYKGETFAIGNDLVEEFKKDHSFEWHFIGREEADRGLLNNNYYFGIMIPKDFSKRATTLTENQPTPLELIVKSNEGLNYTVAKIGESGVEKIRGQLSEQLTRTYTEAIFNSLEQLKDGMQEASKGAGDLHTGMTELASGTDRLLSEVKGRQASLKQLDEGAASLQRAAAQLASGAAKLEGGVSQAAAGMSAFGKGLSDARAGGDQLAQGLKQISTGSDGVNALIAQLGSETPELAENKTYAALTAAGEQVSGGLKKLSASLDKLNKGMADLTGSFGKLEAGVKQADDNLKKLSSGASELSKGAASLKNGVHQLRLGWDTLISGLDKLAAGERKLVDGSSKLSRALADGAEDLKSLHASQPLYEMMANPVRLKEEPVTTIPNYGTGMAPFFISISLYVGALLLSTVFPLRETASPPPSGWSWFLSKYVILAIVSLFQVIILCIVLIGIVGIEPRNTIDFGWFTLFISLVFMAVIQLLVTVMDNVGRFIGIILLVLQLTATEGTFPVELIPEGLQAVHSFLPITYTVQGLRTILSTGEYQSLRIDLIALLLFGILSILLTIIALTFARKRIFGRTSKEEQPNTA
ncbi:YhgE/Pip domain-containing protein [Paenibacillus spongiae]|uniref:YhgE/Pip domain-containing protein n=1 Tax=Paenibacillus spongiae TaxID=2909671 RepID=A0ABY5S5L4_9BACL|nr:YhgE/Pip domain-containing protein [Paenibacillus spongiae]UVI28984.1 YhgE/Pip domain-containing protein [Paenibacillus spongiae]